MKNFAKGDRVRATYNGRTVKAVVTLASQNGRSLVIDWTTTDAGMLGGHIGVMPIFRLEGGEYRALLDNVPVTLEEAT